MLQALKSQNEDIHTRSKRREVEAQRMMQRSTSNPPISNRNLRYGSLRYSGDSNKNLHDNLVLPARGERR